MWWEDVLAGNGQGNEWKGFSPFTWWDEEVNMRLLQISRLASAWLVARTNIKSERGATAVEYAVMVALIAAVIIAAVVFLGREASETFSYTGDQVGTTG